jgi:hypothetical protein
MTGFHRYLFVGVFLAFMLSVAAQSPNARPSKTQPAAAQPLQNTSWRAFYKPLTDTVTLRFGKDSSFMVSSLGVPILLSTIKWKGDLIVFRDYGGMNACANLQGSYHVKIDSDTLTLVTDEDPCDARGGSLITERWIRKPGGLASP